MFAYLPPQRPLRYSTHLRIGDGVDDGGVGLHVVEEVHLHPVDRLPVRLFGGVRVNGGRAVMLDHATTARAGMCT